MRFRDRRRLSPEGRKGVDEYTAKELHAFLVEDAVKRHATFLPWAIAAYERIGRLDGCGAEAAFQRVLDDVEQLTGSRLMPITSPITPEEMARMMQ